MVESRAEIIKRVTGQYKNIFSDFPDGGQGILASVGRIRVGISKGGVELMFDSVNSLANDSPYISDVLIGPLDLK
jgi:hypothetical protein